MKPSVMANATASASTSTGNDSNDISQPSYGINIPINHEYGGGSNMQQPSQQYYNYHPQQSNQQPQHHYNEGYGSPRTQQYTNQHPSQEHQMPTHFQQFGFDPEMDVDMFPRSRLGRMHDPFAGFGTTRKRSSFHDPLHPSIDGFSHYFDDPDFDFPAFSTMGRRRPGDSMADDHDLFNRLPSEFRQFMPDGFTHRRTTGNGSMPTNINPQQQQQQQPQQSSQPNQSYYSGSYIPTGNTPPATTGIPQSPSKKLCDAAIQTEDPNLSQGRSEIDGYNSTGQIHPDNLNHHGLRNTVDMGVKSAIENEMHGPRSHSAPPPEQQQQSQQHFQQQHPQKIPINGQRNTPPPPQQQQQNQSGQNIHTQYNQSQNTPPTTGGFQHPQSSAYYQKFNYPRQQQHGASNQQKQQTPPPSQSPGSASYVRTIPIFVEGRQEPIINSHKEIPNQNESNANISANASASARAFTPPYQQQQQQHPQQQQQHRNFSQQQTHHHPNRPTPFNTQQSQAHAQAQAQTQFQPQHQPHHQQQQYNQQQSQQNPQQSSQGLPPQTPHTMDSINKIQDIQRDVLELMAQVEKFKGTRQDKEYVYLDEMLTRNLLKLDTIDTNGKESIRLARKEAIKCIQASINVLEAKAEENLKTSQGNENGNNSATIATTATTSTSATTNNNTPTSTSSSTDKENSQPKKDSSISPKNSQNDIAAKAAQNPNQQGEEIIQQPNDATQIHEPIPLPPPENMQQPQATSTNDSNSESSPQKANNAADSAPHSSETPSSSNSETSSAESSTKTMESK